MYDFIIIGAGPAGVFCATELTRKGYRACILEQGAAGRRKVCGDGISGVCTEILAQMDFPVERLEEAGAVRIRRYELYRGQEKLVRDLDQEGKTAYGLPRDRTDQVFQEYARRDFGVPIFYDCPVREIETGGGRFLAAGFQAENIIVAAGANAGIRYQGKPLAKPDPKKPVGLSMVVEGKATDIPFFLFDYKEKYEGTYAWIFSVGHGQYNIGLWLKKNPEKLKGYLEEFCRTRVRERLGDAFQVILPPRGAFMGIGEGRQQTYERIYFAGDFADTSNREDGEGISRAVLSAKKLVQEIIL